jgi:hypothetical protein
MQLLGRSYDGKMVQYLDMVGKIHTSKAGNKEIHIPLVQMNALMGLLADILTEAISQQPLDPMTALRTLRAFHKLLWIQNDFIHRHYEWPVGRASLNSKQDKNFRLAHWRAWNQLYSVPFCDSQVGHVRLMASE